MICPSCGNEISATGARFCSRCGARADSAPAFAPVPAPGYAQYSPVAARSWVRRHLQVLGILWCVYVGFRLLLFGWLHVFAHVALLGALGTWRLFGGFHLPPILLGLVGLFLVLDAVACYGLIARRPWGRVVAIIAAIPLLLHIFLGTALAIYTLVVLLPESSRLEYESLADHR